VRIHRPQPRPPRPSRAVFFYDNRNPIR
jgi:hypothetical protein